MSPTTVIIADAHFLVREGLRCIVREEPDIQVIGEAAEESRLFNLLKNQLPAVLIVDYNQPGAFSKQTILRLRQAYPQLPIMIISADRDQASRFEVLEYRVTSFLTKYCQKQEVLTAIRQSAAGERFFCSNLLNTILEKNVYPSSAPPPSALSPRELEILQLVTQGLIAKEIADQLHLSTHTVYTHRKNILKKLKLSSTSELILYAVRNGMVAP